MKFEAVKLTVARGIRHRIMGCYDPSANAAVLQDLIQCEFKIKSGLASHELVELYANKAFDVVMNWDVRCVGRLRELFPDLFPPSLKTGRLVCYMADNKNCDWMVERS